MNFNINDLIIDRPLRGTLFDKASGDVIFTIDQISDPSLECTTEAAEVRDAIGNLITEFERSKNASFTGSNALVNLGLMAAQFGSDKELASSDNKIVTPRYEMIELGATSGEVNTTITLNNEPTEDLKYIYRLAPDKSIAEKYEVGATPTTNFSVNGKVVTLPTSPEFTAKDRFGVWYKYEADGSENLGSVKISNTAETFSKGGVFDLEVLFADVCNPNIKYHGHVVSQNAKMDGNVTIGLNNEAAHGFTVKIMQDYCETQRNLFDIFVSQ